MHVQFPVHANVGLAVNTASGGVSGFLPSSTTASISSYLAPAKKWTHPGYALDPRRMVAAIAYARGIINRTTAATVSQDGDMALDTGLSVPAHVARLASKWELVAYSVNPDDVCTEIMMRGPVVATVHVTDELLGRVSAHLQGGGHPQPLPPLPSTQVSPDFGTVIVALLGWEEEHWVAALPWGKFPMLGWDGSVHLLRGTELNVCALAKQEEVRPANTLGDLMKVTVLPPNWSPPTTQPLPAVDHIGTATGKVKALKANPTIPKKKQQQQSNKKKVCGLTALHAWMTDDNMDFVIQCSVTVVIIIVGILTLVLMRKQSKTQARC